VNEFWTISHFDRSQEKYKIKNWGNITTYVDPRRLTATKNKEEEAIDGSQKRREKTVQEVEQLLDGMQNVERIQENEMQRLRKENRGLQSAVNKLNMDINLINARIPKFYADEIMSAQKNAQIVENRNRQRDSQYEQIPGTTSQANRVLKTSIGVPG